MQVLFACFLFVNGLEVHLNTQMLGTFVAKYIYWQICWYIYIVKLVAKENRQFGYTPWYLLKCIWIFVLPTVNGKKRRSALACDNESWLSKICAQADLFLGAIEILWVVAKTTGEEGGFYLSKSERSGKFDEEILQ